MHSLFTSALLKLHNIGNYLLMYEGEVRPIETVLGMEGEGIRENDGGGQFNHDIL
jgi:hypothetical protein